MKYYSQSDYSKETLSYSYDVVATYATFDKADGFYNLHIDDVPEECIHKLCALIMLDIPELAAEATGPDNELFEIRMLPALTKYLANTTGEDEELCFALEWRNGIATYLSPRIESLINETLRDYNSNMEDPWAA